MSVTLATPDGGRVVLPPGAILGRSPTVACPVDDPRASEAHAMVSLRRGQLHLLALRRRFYVEGRPVKQARLRRGLAFELVPGRSFVVAAVSRPRRVTVIANRELGQRVLTGVASLYASAPPRISARFEGDADAHVWNMGEGWRIQRAGGAVEPLEPGATFEVAGVAFELARVPVDVVGCHTTQHASTVDARLSLLAKYDSVEIQRPNRPPEHVGGICARLLTELVAFAGPVAWSVVAAELWRDTDEPHTLRHRWDVTLGRLRGRLRELGVRADLVRTDGAGQVWLGLGPGDTAVDMS